MTSTLLKQLGVGVLGVALLATPALTLARDTSYNPRAVGSSIEVMISQNGRVVVRGAQVTQVSGSTLTARTMWNDTSITWTVRTDSDTDFVRKSGSAADISDIDTGDYVSFSGNFAGSGAFTVDADVVKNWSLSENRTVFTGRITDVDDNDFTLETAGRGTITVETTSSTDYTGNIDAFADLSANMRIVVYGSYDADSKVLTATQIAGNLKAVKNEHKEQKEWKGWFKHILPGWFR